jgi:MFS family permease
MRRLLILTSVMVFFDVTFFAAIAPLLPDYVAEFNLTKTEAGVLAASYAVGTLLAALPAGFVATRVGPRRTAIAGLSLLGAASVVFGFAGSIELLDGARFIQGVAGALIWSGALTWLITAAPPQRRGAIIGTALGAAVAGALVGPVFGAVAAEIGTEPVFGAVMVVALVLILIASRLPETGPPERQPFRAVTATILSRPIVAATALVAAPSLMFGVVGVLVPLRIAELGGDHAVIAAGFVAGAGLEAILAPLTGRYSDRAGRRAPFVTGILVCATAMVGIALAGTLGIVLAALVLSSLGSGMCFTPALTMLSEAADARRLYQGLAVALSNMAWSAGQSVGALAGGAIAGATGYATPCLAVAVLLVFTASYAARALASPGVRPIEG